MDLHKMAPAPALLLGRLLTAAELMGADIKDSANKLTLNIEAEGPLKGALVVYEPEGRVRGYAKSPDYTHPDIGTNWHIGELLGQGTLNVIKDMKLKAPVTGTIQLLTGEVAEDVAQYYLVSEQTPAAVSLGVLFNTDGSVRAAGGYLIQQMPGVSSETTNQLTENLNNTPYITDLLDMGMSWEVILEKLIFKGMDWQITRNIALSYYCPCSKERFAAALRLLGKDELSTMLDGISPICHYCNTQYHFSSEDIGQIISSLG